MAVIRCKVCGKEFSAEMEKTAAVCSYCGSLQTVPPAGDETKMGLYSRAVRLMQAGEYDKASGMYEAICRFYPEDAEAFWGLLICKYGVEYIKSDDGNVNIAVSRPYAESIMDDYNFEMVMDHASAEATDIYRTEAQRIDRECEQVIHSTGDAAVIGDDPYVKEELLRVREKKKMELKQQYSALKKEGEPEEASRIRREIDSLQNRIAGLGILKSSQRRSMHEEVDTLQNRLESVLTRAETEYHKRVSEINRKYFRVVSTGDVLEFGSYSRYSGEILPIRWRILDKKDGRMLIITDRVIDCRPYNREKVAVTWEKCSLRSWLNDEFYRTAFSDEEKTRICDTLVETDKRVRSVSDQGVDTVDKVFLLSLQEVNRYFDRDSERRALPTDYAVEMGSVVNSVTKCSWWWLRSPGYFSNYAMDVRNNGSVNSFGHFVNYSGGSVRPAMWISFE